MINDCYFGRYFFFDESKFKTETICISLKLLSQKLVIAFERDPTMFNKLITSTKVIILMHLIKKDVNCDSISSSLEDNFKQHDSIIVSDKNLDFNVNDVNKDNVNRFEDITILDDDGQIKNIKMKSVSNGVKFPSDNNSDNNSDQVTNQLEQPVTNTGSMEQSKEGNGQKSKFFDEIGRKYRFKQNIMDMTGFFYVCMIQD